MTVICSQPAVLIVGWAADVEELTRNNFSLECSASAGFLLGALWGA